MFLRHIARVRDFDGLLITGTLYTILYFRVKKMCFILILIINLFHMVPDDSSAGRLIDVYLSTWMVYIAIIIC